MRLRAGIRLAALSLLSAVLLSACGGTVGVESEVAAVKSVPLLREIPVNEHSGERVEENDFAVIDYSNTGDGYVMVRIQQEGAVRFAVRVEGPSMSCIYYIQSPEWTALPLSDGDGTYSVTVFRHLEADRYAAVLALETEVTLSDEFAPFIRSNQYVNIASAPNAVALAAEMTAGLEDTFEIIDAVYEYVRDNISYDAGLAATVRSGYLPDLDAVLESKKGICFDYAALVTGMLRSRGIPCKLVVGYSQNVCHAWISVWTDEKGWVSAIVFNGSAWTRMDPTFSATGGEARSAARFIGDGANYIDKYYY